MYPYLSVELTDGQILLSEKSNPIRDQQQNNKTNNTMATRRRAESASAEEEQAPKGRVGRLFEEEDKRIEKKMNGGYMPLRVWQKKGESLDMIFLDASMEDGFAIREHNIQGSDGKWGNYERCLADTGESCPVCKKFGEESYLILFLTVLVLKPWTSKKTGETHEYSKMLLPLKRGQFKAFRKLEQIALKKHGTMRGMYVVLERGNDPQSVSTGEPVPLEDGTAFDMYPEADLKKEFGHGELKSREGKVVKKANEDLQVFDYAKLFPEPTAKELRERYDMAPEPGSVDEKEQEFQEDDTKSEATPTRRLRSEPIDDEPF